jgi:hypothetical protein
MQPRLEKTEWLHAINEACSKYINEKNSLAICVVKKSIHFTDLFHTFRNFKNSLYKAIRTHRGGIRPLSSSKSFVLEKCLMCLDREKDSASNETIFNNFTKHIGGLRGQKLIFRPEKKALDLPYFSANL